MLTPAGSASLIDLDPDLADALDAESFEVARDQLRVRQFRVDPNRLHGKWGPGPRGVAGLLIVEGAMLREVKTGGRVTAELLGPGDLIRPFDEDGDEDLPVRAEILWRVVQPVMVAAIDVRVLALAARWPQLLTALTTRCIRRTQRLSMTLSLSHMVRITDRLLHLFWHLSTHWGRVSAEGVVISVQLTHAQLALMVGTERPTVTTALKRLSEEGLVKRLPSREWCLVRPNELLAGMDVPARGDSDEMVV